MQTFWTTLRELWRSLLGAFIFYTIIPIPAPWQPSFVRIARWCPWIGILLGGLLAVLFWGLTALNSPTLLKGTVIVAVWLGLTGGLHLDGAMDTADGLAVHDPQRRLQVMTDSVSGAFGVMNAVIILLLKVAGITSLAPHHWWLLPFTLAWGRWSQVTAIAFYPYLKPDGKGAFHQKQMHKYPDLAWSLLPILLLTLSLTITKQLSWELSLVLFSIGLGIALSTSKWFAQQLQGHTGDTYGATVEWTETLLLIVAALFLNRL